jgi:hypothetical protein
MTGFVFQKAIAPRTISAATSGRLTGLSLIPVLSLFSVPPAVLIDLDFGTEHRPAAY